MNGTPAAPQRSLFRGFVMSVVRAADAMETGLDRALETHAGLTLAEFDLLDGLASTPDGRLRMTDVSDRLVVSKAGVTRLVDRLEARGLAERAPCPDDRRVVWTHITDAGAAAHAAALPTAQRWLQEHVGARLDAGALTQITAALESLAAPDVTDAGATTPAGLDPTVAGARPDAAG